LEKGNSVTEDPKSNPVHFPSDRRSRIRIRRPFFLIFLAVAVLPLVVAWLHYLIAGLPAIAPPTLPSSEVSTAHPFPAWLRLAHYVNFLFLVLLARSGISILMDHPRLYWNDHCHPATAWIVFTPLDVPTDRVWTAKDDARYISPWLALPGFRHTIGVARHWHLLAALFWFANGLFFITFLLCTDEWKRLVPTSWAVVPEAWGVFVHYATLSMPPEPDPLVRYNALQQLSYFAVVFLMAPLSVVTGLAMSPSIDNRFRWYPRLFGGRQAARSIHFLLLLGYTSFLVMHVSMVFLTNPVRNLNYIVFGDSDGRALGLIVGLVGIWLVGLACYLAYWISWHRPRSLQYMVRHVHVAMRWLLFKRWKPRVQYTKEEISPFFWPNGMLPKTEEWNALATEQFTNYRLKVDGLVENPIELTLDEMTALGKQEQITMHHCIQGWSGIAQWGGLPLARLIDLVKPLPEARVVVFHSFGEGLYGGEYYDTQPMEVAMHGSTLLAYEMNYQPLPPLYGAPLRLRVESQLGYKMVKWIKSIEFVASEKSVGKGHGGKNEDDEYFDLIPEI
jgi:sulfoxide reductase catalytic subunit YedY